VRRRVLGRGAFFAGSIAGGHHAPDAARLQIRSLARVDAMASLTKGLW
jgi:hypothetical protein